MYEPGGGFGLDWSRNERRLGKIPIILMILITIIISNNYSKNKY